MNVDEQDEGRAELAEFPRVAGAENYAWIDAKPGLIQERAPASVATFAASA